MGSQARSRLSFNLLFGVILFTTLLSAWTFRQKEIAEQEADILRQAIVKSDVAFAAIDQQGVITKWSGGAEKMFGWSRKEAIGSNINIIIPEDMREAHRVKFTEAMKNPDPHRVNEIDCFAQTKSDESIRVIARTRLYPGPTFAAVSTFELEQDVKRVQAVPADARLRSRR